VLPVWLLLLLREIKVALEDLLKHCNPLPSTLVYFTCSLLRAEIEVDMQSLVRFTTDT
jgi:hypothetical protein